MRKSKPVHPSLATDPAAGALRDNALFATTLERGLMVLEAIGAERRDIGITELTEKTGLDKSSAQRLTFTLHALGYLDKDPVTRQFRLSKHMLGFAHAYLRSDPLIELATPYLADLRQASQKRVDLSLLDKTDIVYAVRLQTQREAFGATIIGRRLPAFCTSGGRAMLSLLPEREAREIVEQSVREPLTPYTQTDAEAVMAAIARARSDGFAVSVQEALVGEIVVAAPVVDRLGKVRAAVHVAMALNEHSEADVRARFAPMVMATARLISGGGF